MASVVRGLIEYTGVDNGIGNSLKNFREVNFENSFSVPYQKPDIKQIVKVDAKTKILKYEIVETPKGISLEGQEVTGYKLLMSGNIDYKIQYIVDDDTQSMNAFHKCIPFCGGVALPNKFNKGSYINPSALIDDIAIEKIDGRCVYSNIALLLIVDISC